MNYTSIVAIIDLVHTVNIVSIPKKSYIPLRKVNFDYFYPILGNSKIIYNQYHKLFETFEM